MTMHSPFVTWSIILGVAIIVIIATLSATAQYVHRVRRGLLSLLSRADHYGTSLRHFKDRQLESLVDHIPLTADTMTVLRIVFVLISLDAYHDGLRGRALLSFVSAWLLDLFDGLKAKRETQRRGHATAHGKYFDPIVDMLCFAMMVGVMWTAFPRPIILAFSCTIALRVGLFITLVLGRRWSKRWHAHLDASIMPESIAGKFKTVFIALAFGLTIVTAKPGLLAAWSAGLLMIATLLEVLSLSQQGVRAWRAVYGHQLRVLPKQHTSNL